MNHEPARQPAVSAEAAAIALPELSAQEFLSRQLRPLMRALILTGTAGYAMSVAGAQWLAPDGMPLLPKLLILGMLAALGAIAFLPLTARRLTVLGMCCIAALQLGILLNGLSRADPVGWLLPGFLLVPLGASPAWMSHRDFAITVPLSLLGPAIAWRLLDLPAPVVLQGMMYLLIALGAAAVVHTFMLRQLHLQLQLEQRLRILAYTDPLTGIANRAHFFALAPLHFAAARQHAQPLCVLYLDVDHFKSINDRCGHATGDAALVAIAAAMRAQLRSSDLLGRIGGEEFAALLSGAHQDEAVHTAERLRTAVAALDIHGGPISVSIGLAALRRDDASLDILLAAADRALSQAKSNGRNRTELAEIRHDRSLGEPAAATASNVLQLPR